MSDRITSKCRLCDCPEATIVLWGRDLLFDLPGRFALARCLGCGLHYSWPALSPRSLQEHYPGEYYSSVPAPRRPRHRNLLLRIGRRLYRALMLGGGISYLGSTLPPGWIDLALPIKRNPGRLLDVGAGSGRFIAAAIGMGWKAEALDIGPSVCRVGETLGIRTYQGALEHVARGMESAFDLISFNHVLEHLPDPLATLLAARELLSNGGVIRIQIPLWRPSFARLFGPYWSPIDLPRHRFQYRPSDLRRLAARAGLGCVLFVPETGTHPLSSSLKLLAHGSSRFRSWERVWSVDNHVIRAMMFPLGWCLALFRRPIEATFYLMKT